MELIELARRPDPQVLAARIVERKRRTGSVLPAEKIVGHVAGDRR